MKKLLLLFAFVITTAMANAQIFDGRINDAKTGAALPYVNVGVIGKAVGTVTDINGHYSLSLTGYGQDSLRISMVGYLPKAFPVDELKKNYNTYSTISLLPDLHKLKEVTVSNHKWKQVVLGNTTQSESTDAGFTSNKLGNEIGAIIKVKKQGTYLKQFNAALAHAATDTVKLRLNFYSVKDGLPYLPIQQQNIFVTVNKGDKKISVNLEPYFLVVDDKFFVSLEWIQNAKGHGLMFSASLFSSAIIARETSQANWEKVGIAGVGFNVLAEY